MLTSDWAGCSARWQNKCMRFVPPFKFNDRWPISEVTILIFRESPLAQSTNFDHMGASEQPMPAPRDTPMINHFFHRVSRNRSFVDQCFMQKPFRLPTVTLLVWSQGKPWIREFRITHSRITMTYGSSSKGISFLLRESNGFPTLNGSFWPWGEVILGNPLPSPTYV